LSTYRNIMQQPPKKLLDQVRDTIRLKHYSYRTEETYVQWIRRYILFHNKRHPQEMGVPEIESFLTHLAIEGNVTASTPFELDDPSICPLSFLPQRHLPLFNKPPEFTESCYNSCMAVVYAYVNVWNYESKTLTLNSLNSLFALAKVAKIE
jgi:Phage integrase, N-terminal SAM-like domain